MTNPVTCRICGITLDAGPICSPEAILEMHEVNCRKLRTEDESLAASGKRLADAAPELLEALEFVLAKEDEGYISFCGMPWRRKLKALVAKAKGTL